jgi:hypothetical protein
MVWSPLVLSLALGGAAPLNAYTHFSDLEFCSVRKKFPGGKTSRSVFEINTLQEKLKKIFR